MKIQDLIKDKRNSLASTNNSFNKKNINNALKQEKMKKL